MSSDRPSWTSQQDQHHQSGQRRSTELQPISPWEARDQYLAERRGDLRERTLTSHGYRLKMFAEWCDEQGIDNLNDLTGRDLHNYRIHRKEERGLAPATLKSDAHTLSVFLEFVESIEGCPPGTYAKVRIPSLSRDEEVREKDLSEECIERVLEYYEQFHYASYEHAWLALIWHTGCRSGGARALDLEDYDPESQHVEFWHRDETDTPLKNGRDGERMVALSPEVAEILDDYIRVNRRDIEDDHGRNPLFTTKGGRLSRSWSTAMTYGMLRPCQYQECPHDRDPEECEAMQLRSKASKCPSSASPHDIRSAAIMRMLDSDIPPGNVAERVNATQEVISQHYDQREKDRILRQRMEQRRSHFDGSES